MRNQKAEKCGNGDRRQAVRRITANDEFEAVKSAGERGAESTGNSGSGTAADQNAQIGAPQPKAHADARGNAAGQLCIARLQADRGADPA
jgi:hypothetical protein